MYDMKSTPKNSNIVVGNAYYFVWLTGKYRKTPTQGCAYSESLVLCLHSRDTYGDLFDSISMVLQGYRPRR